MQRKARPFFADALREVKHILQNTPLARDGDEYLTYKLLARLLEQCVQRPHYVYRVAHSGIREGVPLVRNYETIKSRVWECSAWRAWNSNAKSPNSQFSFARSSILRFDCLHSCSNMLYFPV